MIDERRLDLGLLERALAKLEQALREYDANPGVDAFRDSVVIRFVFTYELLTQALRRYVQLEHQRPMPEEELTTPRIIRRANALGVLPGEWEEFAPYRDARNAVAHTYNQAKAEQVASLAVPFATQAAFALQQLKERLHDEGS